MLQAGVATKDMDPRWMSSISWYFLCFFGLQPIFNFLLGSDNGEHSTLLSNSPLLRPYPRLVADIFSPLILAANQMNQQMGQMGPQQAQMFGPGVDPDKQFLGEVENLAVIEHYSVLDDVESRLLAGMGA